MLVKDDWLTKTTLQLKEIAARLTDGAKRLNHRAIYNLTKDADTLIDIAEELDPTTTVPRGKVFPDPLCRPVYEALQNLEAAASVTKDATELQVLIGRVTDAFNDFEMQWTEHAQKHGGS